MRKLSRREFFGTAIATAGVTSTSAAILTHWRSTTRQITAAEPVIRGSMTPTSQVSLGKSGLHVSMGGVGTGSIGCAHGSKQIQLSLGEFSRPLQDAFYRG